MQKTILVFGLIAGLIVSTILVVMMLVHKQNPDSFEPNEIVGYASMLLWASLIPVAIKSYRDRHQGGVISFKDAFGMGLGIALIASVMYVVTWVIFYKTVYPNFVQDYTQCVLRNMVSEGKSAADIADMKGQMRSMFSYYDTWWGLVGITFIEIFPIGLVMALISALVLKRSGKQVVTA